MAGRSDRGLDAVDDGLDGAAALLGSDVSEGGLAESGFLAAMTSPTFSVVFGGAACLCILAVIWKKAPPLVQYRVESAEA